MPKKLLPAKVPARRGNLLTDVRELILAAREGVARAVDSGLVTLYWHVGRRIRQDILQEKRAEYGAKIVAALGRQLEKEFGRGFTEKNLRRMVQFAEVFPDEQIVAALRRQLGWTHFRMLIPLDDDLQRDFYAEMCRIEKWNTRTLEKKIGGMLFERTALSKKPEKLIRRELDALRDEDQLTPDLVFRDPYVLDFLGLKDTYAEKDVEAAILREVESFILELGAGFCFVARQKRMQIDARDYHLNLLFYHRKLRRLVAIDLKLRDFEAGDKGQMELYPVRYKRHECILLRIHSAELKRWKLLRRLHQRPTTPFQATSSGRGCFNQSTIARRTCVLRSLPQSARRDPEREISEVVVGQTIHQVPTARLSNGVNLNWLKRHECEPGEAAPLGLVLCAGRSQEHVELLELARSGIHVASFWTKVLPRKRLENKLHHAVRFARARLNKADGNPAPKRKRLR